MKRHSFPKDFRLLKRVDFLPKRERIRKITTRNFTLICSENRESGPRIGIVASKKVGNAATRNRMKRLIREFFRLNRERILRREDIVVIVRPRAQVGRYSSIEEELKRLL